MLQCRCSLYQHPCGPFQICRSIDPKRGMPGFPYPYADARLKQSELLQLFALFKRTRFQLGEFSEDVPGIGVDAEVLPMEAGNEHRVVLPAVSSIGNRAAREV